ncbi:MAG: carboxymuconolactone decarboxylase family protein [Gammaproteobacteria bacterium]|nr:carboxymuconolactone decarboxylase family protein [Gammaproteobacteria bacterium]
MNSEYKVTLSPITLENADNKARPVLDKALKEVGFIPNMYTFMVNSPALLELYLHGYGLFRKESAFSPAEQEVVFLAISRENACHYCVAAHSMLADKISNVPTDVIYAIRNGENIVDSKLNSLSAFTQIMVKSHGRPGRADVDTFLNAGYSECHILDIILAIAVKTLSNYSNHFFHTPVDDMFKEYRWIARN